MWKSVRGGVGKCWGTCGKVCWGVGKVKGDMGRNVRVWKSVGKVRGDVGNVEKCVEVKGEVRGGVGKCWGSVEKCVEVWVR